MADIQQHDFEKELPTIKFYQQLLNAKGGAMFISVYHLINTNDTTGIEVHVSTIS